MLNQHATAYAREIAESTCSSFPRHPSILQVVMLKALECPAMVNGSIRWFVLFKRSTPVHVHILSLVLKTSQVIIASKP
jgi:hypothetical protein